ncbi:MAG: NAD(P)-binding protein [Deltaproteobacteria bacterium]|nr:NAD(P)-binding protein [Deltaproteobacteria bacterium]
MSSPPVVILGAGLTGMSAGYHLQHGYEIHERLPYPGGLAVTIEEKGYRFDRTGHLLHLNDPSIRRWIESMLGDELIKAERRSRVFSHGVYTRYPYQANTFGLPPEVAYECLVGFIKTRESGASTERPNDFEQYCLKYFGAGFSSHFMIPYNRKLWGVHPREITAEWCERFVPRPELEDVIAGAVGLKRAELGYNAEFLYPARGIGMLASALKERLRVPIRFRSAPKAVDWRRRKLIFEDREQSYEVLISTVPLNTLIAILEHPPDPVRRAGLLLRCNPLYYLDVALDVSCGVDSHWVYVPEERYPFYRVGCYTNFSDKMAPPGKSSLYIELASREPVSESRLMPGIAEGLMEMKIIKRPDDIAFARTRRINHAYVLFDHNCYKALEQLRPFLEDNRIISSGRYGGWNYSSMEDALIAGRNAAGKAMELQR